jgi:hypothetical protein
MIRLIAAAVVLVIACATFSRAAGAAENVCVTCHEALPGSLSEPVRLWKKSIHAASGIFCNDCHGGDPVDAAAAMTRERGFIGIPTEKAIPELCGRCHPGVRKDFSASRHGKALGHGGPTCVTCHGNHDVTPASLDIINKERCSTCHDYGRALAIREAMTTTEGTIVAIEEELASVKKTGMETEKLDQKVFAARNRFHTLFHEVNIQRVRNESESVRKELAAVKADLAEIQRTLLRRKFTGAAVVAFFLLSALLLILLRKSYDRPQS